MRTRTGTRLFIALLAVSLFNIGLPEIFRMPSGVREAQSAAPGGAWWDGNYQYRQKISITAGAVTAPTDYSVSFPFNHAALVSAGRSLSSGNDVRIVYWNGTAWAELARRLDDQAPVSSLWNTTTTTLWFRTQAIINASTTNDNYYMYYGYSTAVAPPTTWSNVFLFYDDFTDGTLDTTRWTCTGTCTESVTSPGTLTLSGFNSSVWATATYAIGADTRWEGRVRLSANLVGDFDYWQASDQQGWGGNYVAFWANASAHMVENYNGTASTATFTNTDATSFHAYAINREGTAGVRYLKDGTQVGYLNTRVPTVNLRVWLDNYNSTETQIYDWARVRKYVTPEPTIAALGATEQANFAYRRPITILNAMTDTYPSGSCGANLPSFPILVSVSGAWLRTRTNDPTNGRIESATGYDVLFRASDGVTQLDHEIEKYDGSLLGGSLIAWVRIPTLAYNADTIIYMYYGNGGITAATANPTGVWDSSYKGVWHLTESGNGTAGEYKDSTINANNGQGGPGPYPTQTPSGKIGNGQNYNGVVYISVPNAASLQPTTAITLSGWINLRTFGIGIDVDPIIRKGDANNNNYQLFIADPNSSLSRTIGFALDLNDADVFGSTVLSANTWYYIAGTWSSGNQKIIYLNGGQNGTQAFTGPIGTDTRALYLGGRTGGTDLIDGLLDEVRISNVALNPCWIGTEYNTVQYAGNASYISVGVEGAAGPTAVDLVSLDAGAWPDGRVLVSWRTGFEVDNLGFHVYRDQGGQRVQITPSLIAGSALFAGAGTALTAGRSYAWWDRAPVAGASYWLEEWDLSGAKRWHGQVTVQPGPVQAQGLAVPASGGTVPASSPLLAGFGQPVSPSPPHGVRRRLRQAVASDEARLAVQWWVAGQPAVKLLVSEEGWYRVTQEELAAAGFDPEVDSRRLQLLTDGQEVAMLVDGEPKGRLAPGDGIEFYGVGLDTLSTDARVYWLVAGTHRGLRLRAESGRGQWSPGPVSFPYEVERADRTLYFPALLNADEDNFFGAVVTTTPVEQAVRVQHLDPDGEAVLTVRLQGGTQVGHRVGVELNGVRVGTVSWEGLQAGELVVPVGPGTVREGDNRVVLAAEGGEEDVSAVEFVRVRYGHLWEADGDALRFTVEGFQQVAIGGFASARVSVFDVTDPMRVVEVAADVVKDGDAYRVRVGVPEPGTRTLLAVGQGAVRHPVGVLPNRPSAWHAAGEGADLLVIGQGWMLQAVEPLRALRERQGLKVALVDVENVYDEFSFGAKDPQAIKDLLACAINTWSRPPRYLLLVGDASYDPRNYLGYGELDLVPTKLVDTTYLETASDDWFADFDGDGIADIPVGRIPVQTSWEAATVVGKIVAYEGSAKLGRVLLVADANDKENDFEALSGRVRAALPSTVWVAEVFRGQLGDGAAKDLLARQLNLGQTLVNYVGHGSVAVWHGNLLTTEEARALRNYWFPFVASMTCLNGFFQDPQAESMAEALLVAPGGAVAVWASSGLTESEAQLPIDEALVRLLYSGTSITLGDATRAAKAAASDMDVRRTWILFGDPTTRLK